jgi:uncharacterized membrane protein/cytochrome c2
MQSTASVFGHPIHAILIAFPVALFVTVFIGDLFYYRSRDTFWVRFSYVMLWMAAVWTWIAAIPGLIDYFTMPMAAIATYHFANGLAIGVLALAHLRMRKIASVQTPPRVVLPFSLLMVVLIGLQGFLGGELVYRYHMGVLPSGDLAPAAAMRIGNRSGRVSAGPPPSSASTSNSDLLTHASQVFASRCSGCHTIHDVGGDMGPNLTQEGSRHDLAWILAQVKNPRDHRPAGMMPILGLNDDDRNAVAHYIASLK